MSNTATGHGPNPREKHPLHAFPQVCFIQNTVTNPNILVGDYTYYDDPDDSTNFERNVLYHYPFLGDKLIIGRFCAIGRGAKFIMNGANHKLTGFSTFPFYIFGNGWESATPQSGDLPYKGDTRVGNDVWIGYEATIMPGINIGHGAIIASKSVVTRDVPAYTIVGGNPATVVRRRFDDATIAALERIAWWDWPVEKITRNLAAIVSADVDGLATADSDPEYLKPLPTSNSENSHCESERSSTNRSCPP
ncbi:MAG: Vat family streptogramin A O-acetyltransferase [Planctomycetales bacterium]|nr:Vat family streptogramin A O-acetyltransferase [Planctomycetales bacterium]